MSSRVQSSWGNVVRAAHRLYTLRSRFDGFPLLEDDKSVLPFGNGRSYGDSCLNVGGALLETRRLDRFIRFDREQGVMACESGVQLADILRIAVPEGWFPHVLPGTQFVTVGGAIANDIHGKNHHRAGTFGCHVERLELCRSSGERLLCSAGERPEWIMATVGGLGLTGLITWAEIRLRRIAGPWMHVETVRCTGLEELLEVSAESDESFEYTVAWIDCLAGGARLGRGILQRANHVEGSERSRRDWKSRRLTVPFVFPVSPINRETLRLFNTLHYRRHRRPSVSLEHYQRFFFPLDGIGQWNRLYGRRGFYQYQCVVPQATARDAMRDLLTIVGRSGLGSFLAVLKAFGEAESPGLLSFPRAGLTLALDFPNRGARLEALFAQLDAIVAAAGGRLYPAKDGRMPSELFHGGYPRWREFSAFIDPRFSSNFWRRVGVGS